MLALPDGYALGTSSKSAKRMGHTMLGDEWQVTIYYRGVPAFELAKRIDIYHRAPKYSGRLVQGWNVGGSEWQQFPHYTDAAKVMVAKHRILGARYGG